MIKSNSQDWKWKNLNVSWNCEGTEIQSPFAILLIHGFGACKEHWRFNQAAIGNTSPCYAIDLIGFGESDQPISRLANEKEVNDSFIYCFDNWSGQIEGFCKEIIRKPVILIGNSIGAVIALNTAQRLEERCKGVIGIDCAQRTMDDKRLSEKGVLAQLSRPWLKAIVSQRLVSRSLFKTFANHNFIEKILKIAYPTGGNINYELINLLYKATQRENAAESFRGFINLFDDHLAPNIMSNLNIPVDLIWGENDPWEPLETAVKWEASIQCIRSLKIIKDAGHCPHDEKPEEVNDCILNIIQQAK